MTAHEYFSAPGVSNTMLGHLARSPEHLQSYLRGDVEKTKAMELGTDFHDLLLLDTKPANIEIKPEGMSFATKEGKAWRDEVQKAGKRIVEADAEKALYGMRESILRNKRLRAALELGEAEKPLFGELLAGTRSKARLDLVPPSAAVIDFKTARDASPDFVRSIIDRDYLRQAAYYLDLAKQNGLPHTSFIFVAVEKTPPYSVGIYYLSDDQLEIGRRQYVRLLNLYAECVSKNEWPGYPTDPQPVELPAWFERKEAA